ncbi:MAG: DUF2520 domain-containing protein [Planctomycetes bacterium]|nr:DUF2520 domain-containing protein [Planctomycetota bacterium]
MPVRIAIVGPGRVGTAFAERFVRGSANVLGFVGRDAARVRAAVDALGRGAVLDWSDLQRAHVVVFAVGDGDLDGAVRAAVAAGGRRCSLWLHTSGRHGLDVFAPGAALGIRVGSLHPLVPFSASAGTAGMAGAPALLQGEPRSISLLRRLCDLLGLEAIVCGEHDRVLYHAACALAANGTTALFGLARDLIARAGGLDEEDAARVVQALAGAAVTNSRRYGAGPALSGPVRRGDAATVQVHLDRLQQRAPEAVDAYRSLMRLALGLSAAQGLPDDLCARLAKVLSSSPPTP